jgi:hypothetical protein
VAAPTSSLSSAGTKALDDLFSFDAPTSTSGQQPAKASDPFLDFNAPLISSSGTGGLMQQNQLDTFKTLYTNVGQQPV